MFSDKYKGGDEMVKRNHKRWLALVLIFAMILSNLFIVSAAETERNVNLALNKTVTASAAYSTMPASNLTDADKESRWSTESNAVQWAYVDLGSTQEMNYFSVIWESATVYGADYNIYVSNDTENWGTPVVAVTGSETASTEDILETPVAGRYVKLEVTEVEGYPSVSARDFTIMYLDENAQDPNENVALNKTAVASSIEANSVRAENATDGDTTSKTSRWGSDVGNGPDWIYVDLGEEMNVKTIKLFWENRKATAYEIQTATTLSENWTEEEWTTQKTFTDRPATINETITLDETVKARYVRLYIPSHTSEDPDGGIAWNTVSIYEMEVYGGDLPEEPVNPVDLISVDTPAKGDKKLVVNIPEIDGCEIVYNGTDLEQIVGDDLTIYSPIVDKTVKVSFKITETATGDYEFKEIDVVIPGTYTVEAGDNASPVIVPELTEWKGYTGVFTAADSAKIVYANDELKDMAEVFAADYEEITGKAIATVKGDKAVAKAGDYFFALTTDTSLGLQDEGYLMEINDIIDVQAETETGAYWATRTILQSFKANDNTINKGITRDYPLYEIRGFILDVGRKTFTMDYLEQVVKMMSWYKMNDFQVHLNDNLIPLENYSAAGEDPMQAYSAFRLESDIKEGGNNGLNKADLTSKDVFYTKDEFRSFIQDARLRGVDIVPEIDTPAHSLALTKVRPDLRQGTYGRQNDHLNLTTMYGDSLAFVQSIFAEYLTDENPVFDEETIVHVGADEYTADGDAFRRFCNDMFEYVQNKGRTARVWGSLTSIKGSGAVEVRGDQGEERVQMNLWNFGWANMDEMYELGFDLINCNDGNYYIVPNAGYYYDYLYDGTLYNLSINSIGGVTIPAGDDQMKGGAFAVWNDMTDYLENGVSEYDVYDRITDAIPLFAAKLWGKQELTLDQVKAAADKMGDGPGTNFGYEVEADENGVIAKLADETVELKGRESYVETGLSTIGLNNSLRVKVKRTTDSAEEQILFESSYGSIKAVQKDTGKVGFSRENRDYSFNYELPINEWVELEFKNEFEVTSLYVNGKLVDVIGDGEQVEGRPLKATMMFPIEKIGSETNAFAGLVKDVRIGADAEYVSAMPLEYAVETAEILLQKAENADLKALVEQAKAVTDKFAPTQEEVDELAGAINAIIEASEYEKADYSRVDTYISLASGDMSIFTEESVAVVENVIASIRRDLPAEQQAIVDGYEAQLSAAIAGLVEKENGNVNYVNNADLTASASSHQDASSAPSKVLDGDESTMWHSQWSVTTMPHWLQLTFNGEPQAVNGITYLPRQSGNNNGVVTKYEILGSNDGTDFSLIKSGTLAENKDAKEIMFDTVTYKHIRIKFVEAVNNNGSAAEVKLHLAAVEADKEGLKTAIDEAKAIENVGFTEETWNALQETIAQAEALYNAENPDAQDVEVMKRALAAARVDLVLVEKDTQAPTEPTNLKVDKVTKDSIEISWKASEDNVGVVGYKVFVNGEELGEVDTLSALIYNLEAGTKYVIEVKAFDAEGNVSEGSVVEATTEADEVVPPADEDTKPDIKPDTEPDKKPEENKPAVAPETGDNAPVMLWIALAVIALGAVVVFVIIKRKKK